MNNLVLVQAVKPVDHLIKNAPNFLLFEHSACTFALVDLCLQVAIVRELHHYAEGRSTLLKESLLVTCDILMLK